MFWYLMKTILKYHILSETKMVNLIEAKMLIYVTYNCSQNIYVPIFCRSRHYFKLNTRKQLY